ncbi:MAG TPA: MEDS domain-containing protein [Acidimicrobiales bacterium]|nr:MEDS domain-containing protein [Acidimicrobiales bacterium]
MTLLSGVETGHVVHFYDHEDNLARAAADFLGAGLAKEAPALVVATPSHAAAIAAVLEAGGIDVASARAAQLYLELDAQDLLSHFTIDGAIDPALFHATVPPVIDGLRGRAVQPVRAYGEMVDLLWRQGNVQAAHDLEILWNSIGAGRDFGLFCGYSSTVVEGAVSGGRREVADHHHAVVSEPEADQDGEASRRFEPTLFAAGAARRFVREILDSWDLAPLMPEAELVVSELATNAAVHAANRFTVALTRLGDGRVRLDVTDSAKSRPTVQRAEPTATHGRGLRIVSAIAEEWSVRGRPTGKTVSAILAARPRPN